jgi:two-component system response regulator FixJ
MNRISKHIYFVDDDDVYRKSLVRLLRSAGYPVEAFATAQGFLDVVPVAQENGVLILDLRMPGMNGFDLQEKMNELASRLAIIMITADAQPGDREHAISSGAIGFLQKPFEEESLLELIRPAIPPPSH